MIGSISCSFACLVLLASAVPELPQQDAVAIDQALYSEDECRIGGPVAGGLDCGLAAIQRRALGRSALDSKATYEAAPEHKGGWSQAHRCDGAHVHEVAFIVHPKALSQLEQLAVDLTNPASPNYRRWMSRAEVSELTRNDRGLEELRGYLQGFPELSVKHFSRDGDLLRVHGPVSALERVLGTEFYVYRHVEHDSVVVRSPGYFLPSALKDHVAGVLGAVDFEELLPHRIATWDLPKITKMTDRSPSFGYASYQELERAKGPSVVSPMKLRRIYNVPEHAERGSVLAMQQANTSQVVFGTLSQHWSPSDRTRFQESFGIPQDNYVKQLKGHESGNSMSGDAECRKNPHNCAEANLDVQYMMGLSPWTQIGYWYVHEATAEGLYAFLNDFLAHFVDAERPPQVISISYGMPEYFVSKPSLLLFEVLAMKLALQGVTILVASGDDGAASFLARKRRDGKDCWSVDLIGFQVSWPASSVWVTGVGATTGPASGAAEVVCQTNFSGLTPGGKPAQITSGGGFSQVFKQPLWQQGVYKMSGRGVPDVALLGHNFAIVVGSRWITADGTSASAPSLGGMLSLINSELISRGRPPVGFLNQLLYASATGDNVTSGLFNDIVVGDNRCAAYGAPCCGGYDAAVGWDPVTGLGSLDISKLLELELRTKTHGVPPLHKLPL